MSSTHEPTSFGQSAAIGVHSKLGYCWHSVVPVFYSDSFRCLLFIGCSKEKFVFSRFSIIQSKRYSQLSIILGK